MSMTRVLGIDGSRVRDSSLFRYRVVTARRKRMAAEQAFCAQPAAAQRPMALDRRVRVAGTAGMKAATRPQQGTQRELVNPNDPHQQLTHGYHFCAMLCQ